MGSRCSTAVKHTPRDREAVNWMSPYLFIWWNTRFALKLVKLMKQEVHYNWNSWNRGTKRHLSSKVHVAHGLVIKSVKHRLVLMVLQRLTDNEQQLALISCWKLYKCELYSNTRCEDRRRLKEMRQNTLGEIYPGPTRVTLWDRIETLSMPSVAKNLSKKMSRSY